MRPCLLPGNPSKGPSGTGAKWYSLYERQRVCKLDTLLVPKEHKKTGSWSSATRTARNLHLMDDCEAWLGNVFDNGDPEDVACIIDALWSTFQEAEEAAQTFAPVFEPAEVHVMIPPEDVEAVYTHPVRCALPPEASAPYSSHISFSFHSLHCSFFVRSHHHHLVCQ